MIQGVRTSPPSLRPPTAGAAHARRGPRSHSAPVALLEVELVAESLLQPRPHQEEGEAIARVLERFRGAVTRSNGLCFGLADLRLLCCWPTARDGLVAGCSAALDAIRGLRDGLAPLGEGLVLRAALCTGTASMGSFGGLGGRWAQVVSGQVAQQLRPAMACCGAGELVVGDDLPVASREGLPLETRARGYKGLPLSALGPWAGDDGPTFGDAPTVELLRCSVVALEICGADPTRGDHAQRIHAAARALQRAARPYGGALVELRHDHRGLFALVAFDGSRSRARRAALGALRFGHELGHVLAGQGLDVPAAVSSGTAWTWTCGGLTALVGEAVQRAVELMGTTASELVCDELSAKLVGSRARFEPIRGSSGLLVEQVEASRAMRYRGASGTVGRQRELARIDQLVAELMAGTSGALLLEGGLGVGKSRLVDELVERVRRERCAVAMGYGVPGAQAAPLAPWRSVLLQLLGLEEPVDAARCAEVLAERLEGAPEWLEPRTLASLLPLGDAPSSPPHAGQLFEQVVGVIAQLQGGSPLLVVLEDAQWLDSASWGLARELVSGGEDVLLVAALRTEGPDLHLDAQRLAALPETTVMALQGLGSSALLQLVQREFGLQRLPAELVQWLRATTQGVPLLCLEWIRLLLDDGSLRVLDGVVSEAPSPEQLASWNIEGLEGFVQRRIALMEEPFRRTLAVCSEAGGVFDTELLVEVHPDAPARSRVEAQLERLAAWGLVHPAPARAERAWSVAHGAVNQAVSDVLGVDERRVLHGAIAAWYEQREDDLAPLYRLLAWHMLGAGERERALRYLDLAGAQAMRSGAMPEAVRLFQQALRLGETVEDAGVSSSVLRRSHWERCTGDARYACGELERSALHFERALALLGYRIPRLRFGLALYAAGQLVLQAAHRLLPPRLFEAEPSDCDRLFEASQAAERLAERYYYSADALALCTSSVLSANLADRIGRRGRNARPYASMSYLIGLAGFHDLSRRVYERALEIGEHGPDPVGLCVTCFTRSTYHAGRAEWDRAVPLAERAVELGDLAAAWQESGVARTMLANCLFSMGTFGLAEACYGELLGLARERYNAQHEAWALYGVGECQLAAGRLHEAARSVQQALAVLRNLEDHPSRLNCHGVLAATYARQGRFGQARESADLGWALTRRERFPFVLATLEGYSGIAEAYLHLWERERALGAERSGVAARARGAVRALGLLSRLFPAARPRFLLAKGWSERIQGRSAALHSYREAMRQAEASGTRCELAQAQAALSMEPRIDAARRCELAEAARSGFERLGCAWHLARLEDQQGQLQ